MRTRHIAVGVAAVLLLAGAGAFLAAAGQADPNRICGGVPAKLGGCDEPQPSYSAADCDGVGREFAEQLEARQTVVMNGPAAVNEASRWVRMYDVLTLVAIRANNHLRDTGLIHSCDSDRLVLMTDATVSDPFKARVGAFLWDDQFQSHTYAEWLEIVRRVVIIVDMEKDTPSTGGGSLGSARLGCRSTESGLGLALST